MGAANRANAEEGTVREKFGGSIEENAIHGFHAPETAAFEIRYFFAGTSWCKETRLSFFGNVNNYSASGSPPDDLSWSSQNERLRAKPPMKMDLESAT
jgi:Nucleoside diphosphate kinase